MSLFPNCSTDSSEHKDNDHMSYTTMGQRRLHHSDEINNGYSTWSPAVTLAEDAFVNSQSASTWTNPAEPRVLGLQVQSVLYPSAVSSAATTMSMPAPWSTPFDSTSPACSMADTSRPDSALDYCEPYTTAMHIPATTAWESLQPLAAPYIHTSYEPSASPDHSTYSGSSRPSLCESSPYARSDVDYQAPSPAYLKIEEPIEYQRARQYSHSSHTSCVVTPNEIHSGNLMPTSYMTAKIGMIDVKPVVMQPQSHKVPSMRDPDEDQFEERQKRGYTTAANSTCSCDICGKLFQRSYNLKAHMETHKPNRAHPHRCKWSGCNKQFVRNTDLNRHERSVHHKCRDHVCHLCNQGFPRKDTLRRHVEDGCSRRPEVRRRQSRARKGSHTPEDVSQMALHM